ncbi:PREDICTED: Down syndrome cell adhesion molecule homolog, partial [Poecilia mexicana]|uniref:Down syndrome cell adhesion molecule homolog n=1 Tax=Poecilia mexicana TaxID=48701 RepID=UPI00072E0F44
MENALLCMLGFFFFINPSVTLKHNWSEIFRGETVTLRCETNGEEGTEWTYEWRIYGQDYQTSSESIPITADSGRFSCRGTNSYGSTQWSEEYSLTLSDQPKATITPAITSLPVGGSVTLTCSVKGSAGWKIDWFKKSVYNRDQSIRINEPGSVLSVTQGGVYKCRGGRGDPVFYTEYSNEVDIKTVSIKPSVTLKHSWSEIFRGETVTLRCEIRGGGTEWTYEWRPVGLNYSPTSSEYKINKAHSGTFSCRGKGNHQFTQWTQYSLTVAANKPRASLTVKDTIIPVGGSVALTCSVDIGEGWKIYWYRNSYRTAQNIINNKPDGFLSVSEGGVYSCRGGRGGR